MGRKRWTDVRTFQQIGALQDRANSMRNAMTWRSPSDAFILSICMLIRQTTD